MCIEKTNRVPTEKKTTDYLKSCITHWKRSQSEHLDNIVTECKPQSNSEHNEAHHSGLIETAKESVEKLLSPHASKIDMVISSVKGQTSSPLVQKLR